jgi:glycerol-3-phosphate acyltransferase PlsY
MTDSLLLILLCALAYLAGSLIFALPICRLWRLPDPRTRGSCNPGATNVYRSGGWAPAATVLFLDAAKGALPVLLTAWLGFGLLAQTLVAICAVAGHIIPLFLRFQGGKGVATALGTGLVMAPTTTLAITGVWCLALWRWRVSALASVIAVLCGPAISALVEPEAVLLFTLLVVVVVVRHRSNLIRLNEGQQNRL